MKLTVYVRVLTTEEALFGSEKGADHGFSLKASGQKFVELVEKEIRESYDIAELDIAGSDESRGRISVSVDNERNAYTEQVAGEIDGIIQDVYGSMAWMA